jgi:hypothetical protein
MIGDTGVCFVPPCRAVPMAGVGFGDDVCERHWELASRVSRARMLRARARLERLEALWRDDDFFERTAAGGRYLKLCALVQYAADLVEVAWRRVKLEIFAELGRVARPDASAEPHPPASFPARTAVAS